MSKYRAKKTGGFDSKKEATRVRPDAVFKPKPEQIRSDDQPTQLPKRPHRIGGEPYARFYAISDADALFDSLESQLKTVESASASRIAELEKELRVMRRALESCANAYGQTKTKRDYIIVQWIEAARKEQG